MGRGNSLLYPAVLTKRQFGVLLNAAYEGYRPLNIFYLSGNIRSRQGTVDALPEPPSRTKGVPSADGGGCLLYAVVVVPPPSQELAACKTWKIDTRRHVRTIIHSCAARELNLPRFGNPQVARVK